MNHPQGDGNNDTGPDTVMMPLDPSAVHLVEGSRARRRADAFASTATAFPPAAPPAKVPVGMCLRVYPLKGGVVLDKFPLPITMANCWSVKVGHPVPGLSTKPVAQIIQVTKACLIAHTKPTFWQKLFGKSGDVYLIVTVTPPQ